MLPEGCDPPGRLCYLISSASTRTTITSNNRQSRAIAMVMRVQDNLLSIGLTSLRRNGSLTVAAVSEPFGPVFRTNLRVAALHFAGK